MTTGSNFHRKPVWLQLKVLVFKGLLRRAMRQLYRSSPK
jgi:hypothetical protein